MKKKLIKILLDARRKAKDTKPSNEIYPDGDAASIWNEADSIGSWLATGAKTDLTSISSDKTDGSYSIKAEINAVGAGQTGVRDELPLTLISGYTYTISIWAKPGASNTNNPKFALWTGFSDFGSEVQFSSSDWKEYTWTLTSNATSGLIRIYVSESGVSVLGDNALVDKISILETT